MKAVVISFMHYLIIYYIGYIKLENLSNVMILKMKYTFSTNKTI